MLKKLFNTKIKEIDEKENSIRFIFSTDDEDRHGEIVDQKGWDLNEYLKNPVVLFAHDHYQPAVGQVTELRLNEDSNLEGVIKFAVDEYEFAKTLFNLYKGKFMRAVSAGFINKKYEIDEENDTFTLKENTLLEMSMVNVPANSMALAKSAGIDVSSIEKLMDERKTKVVLKDADIERIGKEISTNLNKNLNKGLANTTKVETPKGKSKIKTGKKKFTTKQINKAVRILLKEKRSL